LLSPELRLKADRLFDFVVPIGEVDCTLFDRGDYHYGRDVHRPSLLTAVKKLSEVFILQLDTNIPTSGTVTFHYHWPESRFARDPEWLRFWDHSLLEGNRKPQLITNIIS